MWRKLLQKTGRPIRARRGRILIGPAFSESPSISSACGRRSGPDQPRFKFTKRPFALQPVAFLAIANLSFERRQKIKSNIRRLKILWVGAGYIMGKRSQGRSPGGRQNLASTHEGGSVHPRQQAGRNRFHIALHSANLPREENLRMR